MNLETGHKLIVTNVTDMEWFMQQCYYRILGFSRCYDWNRPTAERQTAYIENDWWITENLKKTNFKVGLMHLKLRGIALSYSADINLSKI